MKEVIQIYIKQLINVLVGAVLGMGADTAGSFIADLVLSTKQQGWNANNLGSQLEQYVGGSPNRLLPVISSATKTLGYARVKGFLEKLAPIWDKLAFGDFQKFMAQMADIYESIDDTIQKTSGDGNPDTIYGIDAADYKRVLAAREVGFTAVESLVQIFGDVDTAKRAFDALHAAEEASFDDYKATMQRANMLNR
jgi:hypothetical protein